MSVVVAKLNKTNLKKAQNIVGAIDETEAINIAIERIIREFELSKSNIEAAEDLDIDVHSLNRIPPKKAFTVKANFKNVGRRKPMKYDFSEFEEEVEFL